MSMEAIAATKRRRTSSANARRAGAPWALAAMLLIAIPCAAARAQPPAAIEAQMDAQLPSLAAVDPQGCEHSHEEIRNRDGSRLALLNLCAIEASKNGGGVSPAQSRAIEIAYAGPREEAFHVVASIPAADEVSDDVDDDAHGDAWALEDLRHVRFVDLDDDGYFEIEARGGCGAGPNCLGELYRLDPRSGEVARVFSGGYADLRVFQGYLLESGRASCCAWEYHAWPWPKRNDGVLRTYDNMALMVVVGVDAAGDDDDAPPLCTFSRRDGDAWRVVRPPGRAWLSLCENYGPEYRLAAPQTARRAHRSRQGAQESQ